MPRSTIHDPRAGYRVPRTAFLLRRATCLRCLLRLPVFVFALGMILLGAVPAFAQDDGAAFAGKKGVIIAFGLGGAYTHLSTETKQFGETASNSESSLAVGGDFKLGGGLSEQFLLYWFGKTALYNGTGSFGVGTQTSTIVALSGLGASYFLAPQVAARGGVGVTSLTNNRETYYGVGFLVGAEYEFARHWSIDADVMFGKPNPDTLEGVDRNTSSFAAVLTLNWTYY